AGKGSPCRQITTQGFAASMLELQPVLLRGLLESFPGQPRVRGTHYAGYFEVCTQRLQEASTTEASGAGQQHSLLLRRVAGLHTNVFVQANRLVRLLLGRRTQAVVDCNRNARNGRGTRESRHRDLGFKPVLEVEQ